MAKPTSIASKFLMGLIPTEISVAYQALEELSYPINDMQSLEAAVDDMGLLGVLRPTDFPLASNVNAFEKLTYRLPLTFPSHTPSDLEIPREPWESPDIAETFDALFGPACSHAALAEYHDAKRSGASELNAFLLGRKEGERCLSRFFGGWRPPPPRLRFR